MARYVERQDCSIPDLSARLDKLDLQYDPDGYMLLECHMLDGSRLGELTILPYGPRNSFKEPPNHPISPRGLASDMSVVVAICRRR